MIKTGKFRRSFKSLCYLNKTPLQAARELYYIHAQIQAEIKFHSRHRERRESNDIELESSERNTHEGGHQSYLKLASYWRRCWELVSIPRNRHSLDSALVVMISQQLCGVNLLSESTYNHFLGKRTKSLTPSCSILFVNYFQQPFRRSSTVPLTIRTLGSTEAESTLANLGIWFDELHVGFQNQSL